MLATTLSVRIIDAQAELLGTTAMRMTTRTILKVEDFIWLCAKPAIAAHEIHDRHDQGND